MKLALAEGRDRHGVPRLHADRVRVARQGRRASPCTRAPAASIRYLVLNVEAGADGQPRGAQGDRLPDAAADDREPRVPRPRPAAVLDGAGGPARAHRRVRGASTASRRARRRRRRCCRRPASRRRFRLELWYTPTHYGDASADEYAEIQRALNGSGLFKVTLKSAEWAQYSDTLGKQYSAFQLGWFPDYVDAENYLLPFYPTEQLHVERVQEPEDGRPDEEGAGARSRLRSGWRSSSRRRRSRPRTSRSSRTGRAR